MTDQKKFNLRTLVREVCDASPAADPPHLVKEVLAKIGKANLHAALEQALPGVVQSVISMSRFRDDDVTPTSSASGHGPVGTHRSNAAGGNHHPARSRKVSGIRDNIGKYLRERISIGPANTDWKFLGDCTADDLDFAAQVREEMAASNARRAGQLRELAEALREADVDTVRDLPDLAMRLGEAA